MFSCSQNFYEDFKNEHPRLSKQERLALQSKSIRHEKHRARLRMSTALASGSDVRGDLDNQGFDVDETVDDPELLILC